MANGQGNVENLIQGTGYMYWAPVGTTEPSDGDLHDPPPSPWQGLGFTQEGVTLSIEHEWEELEVDQVMDVPGHRLTKRIPKIETSLAEATLENFKIAQNGGTLDDSNESPGASESGYKTFEPTSGLVNVPEYGMLIFDGIAPGGLVRRVLLRRTLQIGDLEVAYTKDGQAVFATEFVAHHVSASVRPYKIIDQIAAPTGV